MGVDVRGLHLVDEAFGPTWSRTTVGLSSYIQDIVTVLSVFGSGLGMLAVKGLSKGLRDLSPGMRTVLTASTMLQES